LDLNDDGTVDASTVTDDNGAYSFTNIAAGAFNVTVVPQALWQSTTADDATSADLEELVSGQASFGGFLPVTLTGQVFVDANGNGILDNGEAPFSNVPLQLDLNADGTVEATVTSDGSGSFTFLNVGPGTHRISELVPNGWLLPPPMSQGL